MAETTKMKVGNMSIEDFKALVSDILDEKLSSYRLIHIDTQGYTYVFTEESLLPLNPEFEAGLDEAMRQGKEGRLISQKEVWSTFGL